MSKRLLLAGVTALAVTVLALGAFGSPTHAITVALDHLRGANRMWLAGAGAAFFLAVLASAAAWHRGLGASGASVSRRQVAQRYAAGCLAGTFAPANAGQVVRVALLSRVMATEGAVFTVIGVSAVVAVVRASLIAALFVVTTASGTSLAWLAAAVLAVAVLGACGARIARGRTCPGRVRHLLDVVRGLAATPTAAVEIVAWVAAGTAAAIAAAACVAASFGVPHPVAAALVIVPAIELARLLPLTPGNVGLTSAAVALALHQRGVPMQSAAAAGIALHAVETIVGLTVGAAGALSLAPRVHPLAAVRTRLERPLGRVVTAAGTAALLACVVASAISAHAALT